MGKRMLRVQSLNVGFFPGIVCRTAQLAPFLYFEMRYENTALYYYHAVIINNSKIFFPLSQTHLPTYNNQFYQQRGLQRRKRSKRWWWWLRYFGPFWVPSSTSTQHWDVDVQLVKIIFPFVSVRAFLLCSCFSLWVWDCARSPFDNTLLQICQGPKFKLKIHYSKFRLEPFPH